MLHHQWRPQTHLAVQPACFQLAKPCHPCHRWQHIDMHMVQPSSTVSWLCEQAPQVRGVGVDKAVQAVQSYSARVVEGGNMRKQYGNEGTARKEAYLV